MPKESKAYKAIRKAIGGRTHGIFTAEDPRNDQIEYIVSESKVILIHNSFENGAVAFIPVNNDSNLIADEVKAIKKYLGKEELFVCNKTDECDNRTCKHKGGGHTEMKDCTEGCGYLKDAKCSVKE